MPMLGSYTSLPNKDHLMRTSNLLSRSLVGLLLIGLSALANASLKIGDMAPDFQLMGSDGKTYSLSQFKGKKPVVIAFFPKAFTGG